MPGASVMARKKGTKPKSGATTKSIVIRATDDYAAWVEEFARFNRTTVSGLFDQALARFAEEGKFKSPPERT